MSDPILSGLRYGVLFVAVAAGGLLAVLQGSRMGHPPVTAVQLGYRGTGLYQLYNPRTWQAQAGANALPLILPPADDTGEKAGDVYDNVRVLRNLSAGQLTRLMVSMTTWVAPTQGCAYCHNVENMALDTNYTKVVARRMLQMTQNINGNWQTHVKATGVTCYTCHRGKPVPQYVWFNNPGPAAEGLAETQTGMAHPTERVGYSSLPFDPFTPFLEQDKDIRVQGTKALAETGSATANLSSMKQAEWTYSLMMVMAQSLGVNCDYCHNTRAFRDWSQSTPARVTAWYGIRMVRDLNGNYLDPLGPIFPAGRKGVLGDSPKVYCATCHQGIYKPLYGKSMLATFKTELGGPPATKNALLAPYIAPPDPPEAAPVSGKPQPSPAPAGTQK